MTHTSAHIALLIWLIARIDRAVGQGWPRFVGGSPLLSLHLTATPLDCVRGRHNAPSVENAGDARNKNSNCGVYAKAVFMPKVLKPESASLRPRTWACGLGHPRPRVADVDSVP